MKRSQVGGNACPTRHQVDVWVHRSDGRRVPARLHTRHGGIELEVHDVSVLVDLAGDESWSCRAAELAAKGLTVRVTHDGMHLLTLGAETTLGWCSAPIRLGDWPGARAMLEAALS